MTPEASDRRAPRQSILDRLARAMVRLDSAAVVVGALKEVPGADLDIGPIAEPLELLTRSLDRQAQLHRAGRLAARRDLQALLVRRARTIGATPPEATPHPIVVAGLPGSRASLLRALLELHPEVSRVADENERMGAGLASICFELRWHVPAYAEWFDGARLDDAYRLLRNSLDATDRRWLLGSPQHLERMSELASTFGELVVVQVGCDETSVIDATTELALRLRHASSRRVNHETVHRYVAWRVRRLLDRATTDPLPGGIEVLALRNRDLLADPSGTLRRVVETAGLEPVTPFLRAVDDYLDRSGLR